MNKIIIKDECWRGYHINRVRKFINGKSTKLIHPSGFGCIRKSNEFLVVYTGRGKPLTFNMEAVDTEINITLLLEKLDG